jgi:hypothetical protein
MSTNKPTGKQQKDDDEKVVDFKKPAADAADAADLSDLWLDSGFGDALTETCLTKIPINKPLDFFRVHGDKAYRRQAEIYIHKTEGMIDEQHFVVAKSMWGKIEEARKCTLVTCIYRDGSLRIWPLKSPRDGEKDNDAWVTARIAARKSIGKWVKLVWVRRVYETRDAQEGYAPEPDWSKLPPFNQIIELAFGKQGVIRDENHPIYRDLIGAAPKKADDDGTADDDDADL